MPNIQFVFFFATPLFTIIFRFSFSFSRHYFITLMPLPPAILFAISPRPLRRH